MVSIVLYAFYSVVNDYQYALILTSSAKAKTIQVGLAQLMESSGKHNWGVASLLPEQWSLYQWVILFAIIQMYLIQGLTAGAVKG